MKFISCIIIFIYCINLQAQNRNSVWCFGDSAGIDFSNVSSPQPITSSLRTRGSCCSISDTSGNLLFYANTRAGMVGNTTLVWNMNNQLMQGGDSIVGQGWYYELTIIPNPLNDNTYYLFSIGNTSSGDEGLYYSKIDMNLNGGLGAVIQKNVMLLNTPSSDGVAAIKHGNGRDWWILYRRGDISNNEFYFFLLTPTGIQGPFVYTIGSISNSNILRPIFSPDGNKLLLVNWAGLIEIYDFDRCSGIPSNPITIEPESCCPHFFTAELSPSGNVLYVGTEYLDTCHILQYDLTSANISGSRDTIYSFTYPPSYASGGALKRGPDDKIYVANGYYNGMQSFYPYADSMYNVYNMYISVINNPDSLGPACDFQPYSFYLGGKRSYLGLPNNPDYSLNPLINSLCDTILYRDDLPIAEAGNLFPNPANEFVSFNSNHHFESGETLKIYNISGQLIKTFELNEGSIQFSFDVNNLKDGIYYLLDSKSDTSFKKIKLVVLR